MNTDIVRAIFRRNFGSYFSNPTGYVFICVFVLLTALAAFWPHDFFNNNLANFDQLNRWFPLIMLVFIPAVTMGTWAEERRLGTDELLLTLPAADLDVVLGKFLAATAIYTVGLIFSLSNVLVLWRLGEPDWGVLGANILGYWLVGLAMLSIGMVASFLTSNLTIAFILGVLFNAPLVFAQYADAIFGAAWAIPIKSFSLAEHFRGFGRGVISLSSLTYFLSIAAVMLYLCVVLIGRRHWLGGRDGPSLIGHYVARVAALVVLASGLNILFSDHDVRADLSLGQISSLSADSRRLLAENADKPVQIDAYISPRVPEQYVQTRLNLLAMLDEFASHGGSSITVRVHNTEPLSEQADLAERQFGITPRTVRVRTRGTVTEEEIFLGLAFTSGLNKVVVPFVDRGVPVEYELIRAISSVRSPKKKRIGVVLTDARLFDIGTESRPQMIITELEKQYEVDRVDAGSPISDQYDCLLAVQPSSLEQHQLNNLLTAIKSGIPTAIFEDPVPFLDRSVPGTKFPRRMPGGPMAMFSGMQQPPPKGNVQELWDLLGVRFNQDQVVYQTYLPYEKIRDFISPEWVWVDPAAGDANVFSQDDPITAGLERVLFLFPGSITKRNTSALDFQRLVATAGTGTGETPVDRIVDNNPFQPGAFRPDFEMYRLAPTDERYNLAVRVTGKLKTADQLMADEGAEDEGAQAADGDGAAANAEKETAGEAGNQADKKKEDRPIDVIVVSDIDCLYEAFFALQSHGEDPEAEVNIQVDNVAFVLNVIDALAGDPRFMEIRKRRPVYPTLTKFETATNHAREEMEKQRRQFIDDFEKAIEAEQRKLEEDVEKVRNDQSMSRQQREMEVQIIEAWRNRALNVKREQLRKERDRKIREARKELQESIRSLQSRFKLLALLVPPLFPVLMGSFVWIRRTSQEREGVSRSRLR